MGVEQHVGDRRDDAAQQVEEHEARRAQAVFDVVAEDPEEEHVAAEVQPPAVQEHRHDDGEVHVLAPGTTSGRTVGAMIEAVDPSSTSMSVSGRPVDDSQGMAACSNVNGGILVGR